MTRKTILIIIILVVILSSGLLISYDKMFGKIIFDIKEISKDDNSIKFTVKNNSNTVKDFTFNAFIFKNNKKIAQTLNPNNLNEMHYLQIKPSEVKEVQLKLFGDIKNYYLQSVQGFFKITKYNTFSIKQKFASWIN